MQYANFKKVFMLQRTERNESSTMILPTTIETIPCHEHLVGKLHPRLWAPSPLVPGRQRHCSINPTTTMPQQQQQRFLLPVVLALLLVSVGRNVVLVHGFVMRLSSHPSMVLPRKSYNSHMIRTTTTTTTTGATDYSSFVHLSHGRRYCSVPTILASSSNKNEHSNDNDFSSNTTSSTSSTNVKIFNSTICTVDRVLSQLTLGFPFFVASFAWLGFVYPTTLLWINRGNIVTILLALVMFGTGLTLQKSDFSNIWDSKVNRFSVVLGVLCQFIIMPTTAYIVGRFFFLSHLFLPPMMSDGASHMNMASALFLGLCFVGCSPGGTASNVVTYIANANVALSVVLTSCSTFAAVVVTPLLIKLLLRNTVYGSATSAGIIGSTPSIQISGWSLCTSTAKVVLLPIMVGMIFKTRLPSMTKTLCRYTPFLSVLFVSMICGGVVAQTAAPLLMSGIDSNSRLLFPIIISAVLLLHIVGFLAGYIVPKIVLPKEHVNADGTKSARANHELTARTISIEVGMQNSALAVVLARSIPNLHPMACLPGAISATVHSCLGSLLAAIWRSQSSQKQKQE